LESVYKPAENICVRYFCVLTFHLIYVDT
jgi:hypothetical protein